MTELESGDTGDRELEATVLIDKHYKELSKMGFSDDKAAEILQKSAIFKDLDLTPDEVQPLVASYLEAKQRNLAKGRDFNRRQNEGGGNLV